MKNIPNTHPILLHQTFRVPTDHGRSRSMQKI